MATTVGQIIKFKARCEFLGISNEGKTNSERKALIREKIGNTPWPVYIATLDKDKKRGELKEGARYQKIKGDLVAEVRSHRTKLKRQARDQKRKAREARIESIKRESESKRRAA